MAGLYGEWRADRLGRNPREVGMRGRRAWRLAAVTVLVFMVGAIPAGATIFERGEYGEPYSFTYDDCGFEVAVEGEFSGQFIIRTGKNKDESAFFLHDQFQFSEVHTNVDTGEWFRVRGHATFQEVQGTRVEGTIFRFEAIVAGQRVVENSDGEVVLRDRGAIRFSILFDTLGDDEPGGVLIEEFEPQVRGPHPGFNTDFCEIVTELIG
jgi:hypothetical protein